MIAAIIGRTFLNAWNKKYQKEYSAKEFFDNEFFRLFYDHPKYMQWITNSPFVQGLCSSSKGDYGIVEIIKNDAEKTLIFNSPEERLEFINKIINSRTDLLEIVKEKKENHKRIKILKTLNSFERLQMVEDFHNKVLDLKKKGQFDGSIAIGFQASDINKYGTTSGQVSDIIIETLDEDVYLSWIGNGLGIGVEGGYSIFLNNETVLLDLYEGWIIYRKVLNDNVLSIAGNQIDTWNGQWLNYRYDEYYQSNPDISTLESEKFFKVDKQKFKVDTIFWSRLFFSISRKFPNESIMGFVYNFADTNTTLGFIPFIFHQATSILSIYEILFGKNDAFTQKKDYENMFGIHIKRACELGAIGLQALEPKGLREYFDKAKMPDFATNSVTEKNDEAPEIFEERQKKVNQKNYENIISFRTYKTWLLAMITKNKQEDLHYSEEVAKAFILYLDKARLMDRKNLIEKELLVAKSKKPFLDGLATIASTKEIDENLLETIKKLRDRVHLMSTEDFGYFIVLLRFDYAYQLKNSSNK